MTLNEYLRNPSVALPSVACTIWVLYIVSLTIYRLYLSPLAKFPGPKLAALTRCYEAYYDIVLKGQFGFNIQDMHKKYGKQRVLSVFCPSYVVRVA